MFLPTYAWFTVLRRVCKEMCLLAIMYLSYSFKPAIGLAMYEVIKSGLVKIKVPACLSSHTEVGTGKLHHSGFWVFRARLFLVRGSGLIFVESMPFCAAFL